MSNLINLWSFQIIIKYRSKWKLYWLNFENFNKKLKTSSSLKFLVENAIFAPRVLSYMFLRNNASRSFKNSVGPCQDWSKFVTEVDHGLILVFFIFFFTKLDSDHIGPRLSNGVINIYGLQVIEFCKKKNLPRLKI